MMMTKGKKKKDLTPTPNPSRCPRIRTQAWIIHLATTRTKGKNPNPQYHKYPSRMNSMGRNSSRLCPGQNLQSLGGMIASGRALLLSTRYLSKDYEELYIQTS